MNSAFIKVPFTASTLSCNLTRIHIQAKPLDGTSGDASAAAKSFCPNSEAGPASEFLRFSLPPLKLGGLTTSQGSDPPHIPQGTAKPEIRPKAGDASSIAVETHHTTAPRDIQGEVPEGEFQKGYQKGLQGIEGLKLDSEPNEGPGGSHSKSV